MNQIAYHINELELGDLVYFMSNEHSNFNSFWTIEAKYNQLLKVSLKRNGTDLSCVIKPEQVYLIQKKTPL